ncbi:MAG: mannose-1-phosphate guanylyltransferase/mannose-6-phosphate isomerase [Rhizomicrobium sp.]
MIRPVILSGGAGSRLWPLSRRQLPKQLLALTGRLSLLQDTALRAQGPEFAKPLIVGNVGYRTLITRQLGEVGVIPDAILWEPKGRNTAPAAAVAALKISAIDPDAILLLMPADHVIKDRDAFRRAAACACAAAEKGYLVALGVAPSGPETGYGYIKAGKPLSDGEESLDVERFVEKPSRQAAECYLHEGGYYWNSGIFVFRARRFLTELEKHEPDIVSRCRAALANGKPDRDGFRLDEESFAACKAISIDYAVMEHTAEAAVVPVRMGWNDIGSWDALWASSDKDDGGNVLSGNVLQLESQDCYLRSEGPMLAGIGLDKMIVVATADAVLVGPRSAAQDVKKLVDRMEQDGSHRHLGDRSVRHSWGSCKSLDREGIFQTSRIVVDPGASLSVQGSGEPARHWIVVSGAGRVIYGDNALLLLENEATLVPAGMDCRLENAGLELLTIIEVSAGTNYGARLGDSGKGGRSD